MRPRPFVPPRHSDEAPKFILCTFTCLYTAGIHAGIQQTHAVVEMMNKYSADHPWVRQWREHDKVVDVRQAGYQENIQAIYDYIVGEVNPALSDAHLDSIPVSLFHESHAALGGSATACSIIVPQRLYDPEQWADIDDDEIARRDDWHPPDTETIAYYHIRNLIRSYHRAV